MNLLPEPAKLALDGAAAATGAAALFGILTSFFGLLSVMAAFAWTCIRIYETKTVQGMLKRRRK